MQNDRSAAALASRFVNGTNCHLFLTGKAGTGKTTFLRDITQSTHKKTIVAAPTGIAAINAGGVTLHSLFQLPFGTFLPTRSLPHNINFSSQVNTPQTMLRNLQLNTLKRKMLKELELLIIDEVSMLRADILDAIDTVLRHVRRLNHLPFGGVQILFIGDLLQLPPVVKSQEWEYLRPFYPSMHFFQALALQNQQPVYIELDKIYRQSDERFIALLNNLRENRISPEDTEILNRCHQPGFDPTKNEGYVYLTTHNQKAEQINRKALEKLPGKSYFFDASVEGDFKENLYPLEYTLELKKGAQVMFVKNDYSGQRQYFNGKIGTVEEIDGEDITVRFNDGSPPAMVEKYTWENKSFTLNKTSGEIEEKIKGSFRHYPIKLAWAITVHKSQGLTFEKAVIDVSSAFAPGQVYVALSRLTSLDGLVLTAPVPQSPPGMDYTLAAFSSQKPQTHELEQILQVESYRYVNERILQTFDFSPVVATSKDHLNTYSKDEKRSVKQKHKDWAQNLLKEIIPVKEVADRFLSQLSKITSNAERGNLPRLLERTQSAKAYFEPLLKGLSHKVFDQMNEIGKLKGTKKYRKELQEVEAGFYAKLQSIHKMEAMIRSMLENKDLQKKNLEHPGLKKERELMQEALDGISGKKSGTKDGKKPRRGPRSGKASGPDTRQITYELFREGFSLEDIAKTRSLAVSTIESHMATFVGKGLVDATTFVEKEKIDQIIIASKAVGSKSLREIKKVLGDEFTYGDLKFAMAAWEAEQDSSNQNPQEEYHP